MGRAATSSTTRGTSPCRCGSAAVETRSFNSTSGGASCASRRSADGRSSTPKGAEGTWLASSSQPTFTCSGAGRGRRQAESDAQRLVARDWERGVHSTSTRSCEWQCAHLQRIVRHRDIRPLVEPAAIPSNRCLALELDLCAFCEQESEFLAPRDQRDRHGREAQLQPRRRSHLCRQQYVFFTAAWPICRSCGRRQPRRGSCGRAVARAERGGRRGKVVVDE
jgi:hypothetical protein